MQPAILLVGPRVCHLAALFERRRLPVIAAETGVEGLSRLDRNRPFLVVLELNLVDLTATEFLLTARPDHPRSSFLLLDEPNKAGLILKTMQVGVDGYVPAPPDESRIFFEVERQLHRLMVVANDAPTILQPSSDDGERILELQTQIDMMAQELAENRTNAERFARVQSVLAPMISSELDEHEAIRLKERLGLASVTEAEVQSLRRSSAQGAEARAKLQADLDELSRKLRTMPDVNDALVSDLAAATAHTDQLTAAIEEMRGDHAASLLAVEEQHAETLAHEERRGQQRVDEAERLLKEVAEARDAATNHAASLEKQVLELELSGSSAVATMRQQSSARERALTEELVAHQGAVQERIAKERQAIQAQHADLAATQEAAIQARILAEKKLIDADMELEELRVKVDYLEREVTDAKQQVSLASTFADEELAARLAANEAEFRRERLRLVEEKQLALGGGAQARLREEELLAQQQSLEQEVSSLRAELSAAKQSLIEHSSAAEQATTELKEALAKQDIASVQLRSEQQRTAQLAASLGEAQQQHAGAQLERDGHRDAVAAAGRSLAAAHAELEQVEARVGHAVAESDDLRRQLTDSMVANATLQDARHQDVAELSTKLHGLEAQLLQYSVATTSHDDQSNRLSSELLMARESLGVTVAERDEARAAADVAVQQLAVLRAEVAAMPPPSDSQAMVQARQELTDAHGEVDRLRAALADGAQLANDRQLTTTLRNLVDAIEPLRWGLGGAIEYFGSLDGKDASLGTHVRNLRLLQATLIRLSNDAPVR